jgi:hypothetical protein
MVKAPAANANKMKQNDPHKIGAFPSYITNDKFSMTNSQSLASLKCSPRQRTAKKEMRPRKIHPIPAEPLPVI